MKKLSKPQYETPVRVAESAAPSTPPAGYGEVYMKSDGFFYYINDAGDERKVVSGVESASSTVGAVRVEDGVGGSGNIRIKRIIAGSNVTVSTDGNNNIQIDASVTGGSGLTHPEVLARTLGA